MVLVLTGITVLAGAALGYMQKLTAEPIAKATAAKQEEAIKMVAPEFDNSPIAEKYEVTLKDGSVITLFPAKKGGEPVGAAVESFTKSGFGGIIKVMVGFNQDGSVRNYTVLQHAETPGLGSKMQEWFRMDKSSAGDNYQSILGKNPSTDGMKVSKDGGRVDAITAATISSRAFLDAVQRAYEAYAGQAADGQSGATTTDGQSGATKK